MSEQTPNQEPIVWTGFMHKGGVGKSSFAHSVVIYLQNMTSEPCWLMQTLRQALQR
jgi:hypothetical protein